MNLPTPLSAAAATAAVTARIAAFDQAIAVLGADTPAGLEVSCMRKVWTNVATILAAHRNGFHTCGDGVECALMATMVSGKEAHLLGVTGGELGAKEAVATLLGLGSDQAIIRFASELFGDDHRG